MIFFNKNLNKAENIFLKFIIKNIKAKNYLIEIDSKEIIKIIYPYEKDKIVFNFLKKFIDKKIEYSYTNIKNEKINCIFPIIKCINKVNDTYFLTISEKLIEIFSEKDNEIKDQNFDIYLSLSNDVFRKLLNVIVFQNIINTNFKISLENLRQELGIENSYSRFYDLEKNILSPFIKEVEENTNIKVKYSPLRKSKYSNSKILGLKFTLSNMKDMNNNSKIKRLYNLIKEHSENNIDILNITNIFLDQNGYDYVKRNFDYTLMHCNNNFNSFFIFALKYDYFNNKFIYTTKRFHESDLVFKISKIFESKNDLIKALIDSFKNIDSYYTSTLFSILNLFSSEENFNKNSSYNDIRKKLFVDFKVKNDLFIEIEGFNILIEYNGPKYNSYIYTYKKADKN